MQLTVLGTATPYPKPGAACSGYLLQAREPGAVRATNLWVDAGTGTLAELQRHIGLGDLDGVFISHRHADHSADLLVAYYALRYGGVRAEGASPVPVIGPEGLAERLVAFLGPSAASGIHEVFAFTEMHGWGEQRVGSIDLEWGPVSHGVPAFGLAAVGHPGPVSVDDDTAVLIQDASTRTPPHLSRFAYSGDSAPCTSLVELAEHAALLLCEVGSAACYATEEHVHHTPEEAGGTATAAGVGRLVLTHLSDALDAAAARSRASTAFSGPVDVAETAATYTF